MNMLGVPQQPNMNNNNMLGVPQQSNMNMLGAPQQSIMNNNNMLGAQLQSNMNMSNMPPPLTQDGVQPVWGGIVNSSGNNPNNESPIRNNLSQ